MENKIFRRKFPQIPTDGYFNGPMINGKILKVVFINDKELPDVNIEIFLDTQENILNLFGLRKGIEVFKPRDIIDDKFMDYYYSTGVINVKVTGLKDGENFGQIYVLFTDR